MDRTTINVMDYCGEYFARLCEMAQVVYTDVDTVTAALEGKYRKGDLVRIHGAYTSAWGDFGPGEVYEVAGFDGRELQLDRPLSTRGTYLFIAYMEPPRAFLDLCAEIAAWEEKHANARGLASESIDGSSWSAAPAADGKQGWRGAFYAELKQYRSPKPTPLYYARNAQRWEVVG